MSTRRPHKQKFPKKVESTVDLTSPEAIFAFSRIASVKAMPMCSPALRSLTPIFVNGLGTMGTDKYYRVYVDKETIVTWVKEAEAVSAENPCGTCGDTSHHPIAYVAGVLCHETWHPLREHYKRCEQILAEYPMVWNIGCDCEINDDLLEIFKHCNQPKLCIPPSHLHIPKKHDLKDGGISEMYYYQLLDKLDEQEKKGEGKEGTGEGEPGEGQSKRRCGSACDGREQEHEAGEPKEGGTQGISEAESRMIRRDVAKEIKKSSRNQGNVPGGFQRWADKELETPKYDWRKEFRKVMRWSIARTTGDEISTYRRLGRRSAALNYKVVFPSTYSPAPRVAIVQDTSGSMSDEAIKISMSEAEGICKSSGAQVAFVDCDCGAGKVQEISSARQANVGGGGGTDMRVGITAAMNAYPPPNIIVVLTDGFTPWPDQALPLGTKLVIGLVGEHACEVNETPSWSTAVRIIGDDIKVRKADETEG